MPTIRANGLDVGYDVDTPDGADDATPPLVLLHGATSLGADDWAAQRPILARTFRCYLPDARGHGRSRWDAADGWTHDQRVDDLAAFVSAAACLMSARARMKPRGMRWPLIGKFRTARWVDAP